MRLLRLLKYSLIIMYGILSGNLYGQGIFPVALAPAPDSNMVLIANGLDVTGQGHEWDWIARDSIMSRIDSIYIVQDSIICFVINEVTECDTIGGYLTAGDYQDLLWVLGTTTLSISEGNSVDLSGLLDNTDSQNLTWSTPNLSISGGNSQNLSALYDNTDTQDLSIDSTGRVFTVSLTDGGFIKFEDTNTQDGTGTDDQAISIDSLNRVFTIDLEDGGTVKFQDIDTNTDTQDITIDSTGRVFTVSLVDGGTVKFLDTNTQDGTGTDDQTITIDSTGRYFGIDLEDGGRVSWIDTDTNTDTQDLGWDGTNLSLTDGGSVNLSGLSDGTGTDDQTIDVFSISGNNVQLSIESDGEATKTVDISSTTAVTANSLKVTNATHTGEVTGSGALTLNKTGITNRTAVTPVSGDYVLISDASDSYNLKKVNASNFLTGTTPTLDAVLTAGASSNLAFESGDITINGDANPNLILSGTSNLISLNNSSYTNWRIGNGSTGLDIYPTTNGNYLKIMSAGGAEERFIFYPYGTGGTQPYFQMYDANEAERFEFRSSTSGAVIELNGADGTNGQVIMSDGTYASWAAPPDNQYIQAFTITNSGQVQLDLEGDAYGASTINITDAFPFVKYFKSTPQPLTSSFAKVAFNNEPFDPGNFYSMVSNEVTVGSTGYYEVYFDGNVKEDGSSTSVDISYEIRLNGALPADQTTKGVNIVRGDYAGLSQHNILKITNTAYKISVYIKSVTDTSDLQEDAYLTIRKLRGL